MRCSPLSRWIRAFSNGAEIAAVGWVPTLKSRPTSRSPAATCNFRDTLTRGKNALHHLAGATKAHRCAGAWLSCLTTQTNATQGSVTWQHQQFLASRAQKEKIHHQWQHSESLSCLWSDSLAVEKRFLINLRPLVRPQLRPF